MPWIIKFIGCREPHKVVGKFLRSYDPAPAPNSSRYDGGDLMTTEDMALAKKFEEPSEAYLLYLATAPYPFHVRPDGKPNRPLTAFTIEVSQV